MRKSILILISVVLLPMVSHQGYQIQHSDKKACAGCNCEQMALIGASASYSWSPSGMMCGSGPLYPMAWDTESVLVRQAIEDTGALMGFNEPDNCAPGGSCQDLDLVVTRWPMLEAACYGSCRLVGPAPSQNSPDWYLEFYDRYEAVHGKKPKVDVLAAHCFFSPDTVDDCVRHVGHQVEIARGLGIPSVWVTEWASLAGTDHSIREAQAAGDEFLRYMEGVPEIEMHFWYTGMDECQPHSYGFESAQLFHLPCLRLTAMGEWYAGK